MIKHIIWDFDGTLFDTYPKLIETFFKMLKDIGINESQAEINKHFKISFPHTEQYYQKKYQLDFDIEKRYTKYKQKYINLMDSKPYNYIPEICHKIVLSGKYNYLYTHKDLSAIQLLEFHNLKDTFRDFITRENNFPRKPNPLAIQSLIEKYNLIPEETLMIGDRDLDIMAGKNAGTKTCYFDEDNTKLVTNADYTINNFKELEYILEI